MQNKNIGILFVSFSVFWGASLPRLAETQPSEASVQANRPQNDRILAYKQHAEPCSVGRDHPRIALVLLPVGLLTEHFQRAIAELPGAITFAISPYFSDIHRIEDSLRDAHHEVMMILPLEPLKYPEEDPGPYTLLTNRQEGENHTLLRIVLGKARRYVGVVNAEGSKFIFSQKAISSVLTELHARGLYFLNCPSATRNALSWAAKKASVPWGQSAFFIDTDVSPQGIRQALSDLESIARAQGVVIAVGRALPVTLEAIKSWSQSLPSRGVSLIPITATLPTSKE